jgi:hypothetical protein
MRRKILITFSAKGTAQLMFSRQYSGRVLCSRITGPLPDGISTLFSIASFAISGAEITGLVVVFCAAGVGGPMINSFLTADSDG